VRQTKENSKEAISLRFTFVEQVLKSAKKSANDQPLGAYPPRTFYEILDIFL